MTMESQMISTTAMKHRWPKRRIQRDAHYRRSILIPMAGWTMRMRSRSTQQNIWTAMEMAWVTTRTSSRTTLTRPLLRMLFRNPRASPRRR